MSYLWFKYHAVKFTWQGSWMIILIKFYKCAEGLKPLRYGNPLPLYHLFPNLHFWHSFGNITPMKCNRINTRINHGVFTLETPTSGLYLPLGYPSHCTSIHKLPGDAGPWLLKRSELSGCWQILQNSTK